MRKIAVANWKGGVGKTTTSVSLAVALATAGIMLAQLADINARRRSPSSN